jgi:hypothetical protein
MAGVPQLKTRRSTPATLKTLSDPAWHLADRALVLNGRTVEDSIEIGAQKKAWFARGRMSWFRLAARPRAFCLSP